MSIPFAKTKDTTLHLTTFLDFGKYKNCRVDSIIEQDHEYIQYLKYNKIRTLSREVLEKLDLKFSASCIETDYDEEDEQLAYYPVMFDDMPF